MIVYVPAVVKADKLWLEGHRLACGEEHCYGLRPDRRPNPWAPIFVRADALAPLFANIAGTREATP